MVIQCNALTDQVKQRVPSHVVVRVSNRIQRMKTLEDGSVVFKAPANSFADWDFGRVLHYYVDDHGDRQPIKKLSPIERQTLSGMLIGGEIHQVAHARDKVFKRRLRGHTIVMPCNTVDVLNSLVTSLPRKDIAKWVKIIFQGTKQSYSKKIASELNSERSRMEYDAVVQHVKKLQQTGVYADKSVNSEKDCLWSENVNAIQNEITAFNDHRATVQEAKTRADTAEQWDPTCKVTQDPVRTFCGEMNILLSTILSRYLSVTYIII